MSLATIIALLSGLLAVISGAFFWGRLRHEKKIWEETKKTMDAEEKLEVVKDAKEIRDNLNDPSYRDRLRKKYTRK